jgi:hypothetical protein
LVDEDVSNETRAIQRDPTFTRAFADMAVAYFMGRDVELVFLIEAQELRQEFDPQDDDGRPELHAEPCRTEVSRVRLSPGAGIALALDILRELVPVGRIKIDPVRRAIDEILSLAPEKKRVSEDSEEADRA